MRRHTRPQRRPAAPALLAAVTLMVALVALPAPAAAQSPYDYSVTPTPTPAMGPYATPSPTPVDPNGTPSPISVDPYATPSPPHVGSGVNVSPSPPPVGGGVAGSPPPVGGGVAAPPPPVGVVAQQPPAPPLPAIPGQFLVSPPPANGTFLDINNPPSPPLRISPAPPPVTQPAPNVPPALFNNPPTPAGLPTSGGTPALCSGTTCVHTADLDPAALSLASRNGGNRVRTWQPKVLGNEEQDGAYFPEEKDIASLVSVLEALGRFELRFLKHCIDDLLFKGLAVDVDACRQRGNDTACGRASNPFFMTLEELVSPVAADDDFEAIADRSLIKLASFFDMSLTDTAAVCAAVGFNAMSPTGINLFGPNMLQDGRMIPGIRLGMHDNVTAMAANFELKQHMRQARDMGQYVLPPPPVMFPQSDATIAQFVLHWQDMGLSVRQGVAMMGVISLSDGQGCFEGPTRDDYCDPLTGNITNIGTLDRSNNGSRVRCTGLRAFTFDNHYFHSCCSPTVDIIPRAQADNYFQDTIITGMRNESFRNTVRKAQCLFTSQQFRDMVTIELTAIRTGVKREVNYPQPSYDIWWPNEGCNRGPALGVDPSFCPHPIKFPFDVVDARIGQACSSRPSEVANADNITLAVREGMLAMLDRRVWEVEFKEALVRLLENQGQFLPRPNQGPFRPTGEECSSASGFVLDPAACPAGERPEDFASCSACPAERGSHFCSPCCRCLTAFVGNITSRLTQTPLPIDQTLTPPAMASPPPFPPVPERSGRSRDIIGFFDVEEEERFHGITFAPLNVSQFLTEPGATPQTQPGSGLADLDPENQDITNGPPALAVNVPGNINAFNDTPHAIGNTSSDTTNSTSGTGSLNGPPAPAIQLPSDVSINTAAAKLGMSFGAFGHRRRALGTKHAESETISETTSDSTSAASRRLSSTKNSHKRSRVSRKLQAGSRKLQQGVVFPRSPFEGDDICVTTPGEPVEVDGFPSTPFRIEPFQRDFTIPPLALPEVTVCRADGHCLDAYELDIIPFTQDLTCPTGNTSFVGYGGIQPGPLFRVARGRETIVRFNNRLVPGNLGPLTVREPCIGARGPGRPISVHLHGSASLAPYDGWAEDTTCGGESKDYVYPNPRAAMLWYHDHHVDITADNVYTGMHGMYMVEEQAPFGSCGEPWNLNALPEVPMLIRDVVLDGQCQLFYDHEGPHENNLYGDINLVNGQPWPRMTVEPRWMRFRVVNSAAVRPFQLRIVTPEGDDVSGTICRIVGSDGGLRRDPAIFPAVGLFVAVAERWDIVCDFSRLHGRTLYMINQFNEARMDDVPFFCYSHLMARITVSDCPDTTIAPGSGAICTTFAASAFDFSTVQRTQLDEIINATELNRAIQLAADRNPHRTFRFERSGGQWVINGETWRTNRVATNDEEGGGAPIGQNTWEVWRFETGGGWFHPVHVHLVDFYILSREGGIPLQAYERLASKDMVQLDEGTEVMMLARYGPHRGEWMMHCHNLVHEDHEMLRAFQVTDPLETFTLPEARGNNFGFQPEVLLAQDVLYDRYQDPTAPEAAAFVTGSRGALSISAAQNLALNLHRLFYPTIGVDTPVPTPLGNEDPRLANPAINPWLVRCDDGTIPRGVATNATFADIGRTINGGIVVRTV